MAQWGKADFEELKSLQSQLLELESTRLDMLYREMSKELAARLLALVIPRTPVGIYPSSTGKTGGTLRRGWSAQTSGSGNVTKSGSEYIVEVINPVEYADYVEYGHKTVNGSWVEGRYFLTVSESELEKLAPSLLEKKLRRLLSEVTNVGNKP